MNAESKTAQLITKLIRETSKGNLKWSLKETPRSLNSETEQSVPLYFETKYKGKCLGIFDRRTKNFHDEYEYHWFESIGFCIVDHVGKVVWESNEYFPALQDLFNAVREQVSGIEELFEDLLKD